MEATSHACDASLNALATLAFVKAACLIAEAAHVQGLTTSGVGFQHDPRDLEKSAVVTALRDNLIARGVLMKE